MISYFNKSDIDHESYKNLYLKLKESIGDFELGDRSEKISGIYYIYNTNNELMYIGQSKNIASRLTTHIRGKYKNSHKIIIEPIYEDSLDDIERFLIDKLKPIDNIMVGQKYNINNTRWIEFIDTQKLDEHINNGVKTIVYPTNRFITSIDLLPDLLMLVKNIDSIDKTIIDNVIKHVRGEK